MHINRILFATDFSPSSEDALTAAAELADRFDASVTVLHVLQLPFGEVPPGFDIVAEIQRGVQEGLEKVADQLRLAGAPRVEVRSVIGIPYHEITLIARDEHFDLIVIGTHGRTGFRRALVGSVAEQVLRHAPCPVLTLRPLERPHAESVPVVGSVSQR